MTSNERTFIPIGDPMIYWSFSHCEKRNPLHGGREREKEGPSRWWSMFILLVGLWLHKRLWWGGVVNGTHLSISVIFTKKKWKIDLWDLLRYKHETLKGTQVLQCIIFCNVKSTCSKWWNLCLNLAHKIKRVSHKPFLLWLIFVLFFFNLSVSQSISILGSLLWDQTGDEAYGRIKEYRHVKTNSNNNKNFGIHSNSFRVNPRGWLPTPVFLSGKPHGRRSLVGYSPGGPKSWKRLSHWHFHFYSSFQLLLQGS